MPSLLEARGLVNHLGGRRVVDGVDLSYHLAQAFRGVLLGGPVAGPLLGVAVLSAVMLGVLVPLDLRLLRRRVLGD